MKKSLFRFVPNASRNTLTVIDGDGTIYHPFIRIFRIFKKEIGLEEFITGASINIYGLNIFSYSVIKGMFWFRFFGYGAVIKDTKFHGLLFSERNGYVKRLQIGKYSIKIIKPNGN